MAIFLTILKWIGIILLVVLIILLLLLLLVLFVPIRYKLRAAVNDPESHEEFPLNVLKEQSDVMAEVTWFWGILKVLVQYPGEKLLDIRIFGKSLPIGGGGEEKEEASGEPEKEEKEEEEKEEDAESVIGRIGRLFDKADYYWRVITGRCGRRATDKIISAVKNIVLHVIPQAWKVRGTLGLSDPCLNGKISGLNAILMTMLNKRIDVNTQWERYRCDLNAEIAGKIVLIYPAGQVIPLIFDKDIRKVIKKIRRAGARFG